MRNKELSGQITILAGLVFGIIVSLMVVMIESAVSAGAKTKINTVVNLGMISLFSQYSRPVLEKYDILGSVVSKEDEIIGNISNSIHDNIDFKSGFDPYGIKLTGLDISEEKLLTDDNGRYFYEEITEYMKLGQFDNSFKDWMEELIQTSGKEKNDEILSEIEDRQEEAVKIDGKILKVLMCVEGVKTTANGLKQTFGRLSSTDNFAKRIIYGKPDMAKTGIPFEPVYNAVSGRYYDISEKLNNLKGELDLIVITYYNPLLPGIFNDAGFRREAVSIAETIGRAIGKIDEALKLLEEIKADIKTLSNNLDNSYAVIQSGSDKLSDEMKAAYELELEELRKYETGEAYTLFNIEELSARLLENRGYLEEICSQINVMASSYMDIDTIGEMYGMVDRISEFSSAYNCGNIYFNYNNVSVGRGESLAIIKSIRKFFGNNAFELIVGDASDISEKVIKYKDLSSSLYRGKSGETGFSINPANFYRDYLYNKYVNLYFSSYINPNKNGLLSYETEYIIGNKNDDRGNLKETINQLVALRFTMDFSFIMSNLKRREECLKLSAVFLGFTGVYGVIKAGQLILLAGWSYAEAVNDVRILVNGGRVPFKKSEDSWKTDINDVIEKRLNKDYGENKTGLKYEEYLQLLLFVRDRKEKIYRTMDMMEINMIYGGHDHIRMYKYMYSVKGRAEFSYRNKYDYTQDFEFGYW